MTDTDLQKAVLAGLQWGTERLSGPYWRCSKWHDKQLAAATAWTAPGVTDVENDIVIA